jgi:pyrroline-5-carboxylate reductase
MNTSIGIIGLGRLGSALARGIDRSGHTGGLCAFNRSASKAEAVAAQVPRLRLCSCGPALYVTMMELLADTLATRRGYDRDFCRRMVRETMLATLLLQESDEADASEIVARVAHPGGRSEAGVVHLRAALPPLYEAMLRKMRAW